MGTSLQLFLREIFHVRGGRKSLSDVLHHERASSVPCSVGDDEEACCNEAFDFEPNPETLNP